MAADPPFATDAATTPSPDRTWSYVAAFGALWGSVEITLGAFLHVLHLPLAGVLLASLGALLLVAARQVYPRRGTTLAIGVVAALCKSISPGGIILGPMLGIATEAALVEAALLPAPRSRITAVLAGTLCALWSAFQKVIAQVVFYGSGVLGLYLAALVRAREWLALPRDTGWWALGALLLLIVLIGGTAGWVGRGVGAEALRRLTLEGATPHDG